MSVYKRLLAAFYGRLPLLRRKLMELAAMDMTFEITNIVCGLLDDIMTFIVFNKNAFLRMIIVFCKKHIMKPPNKEFMFLKKITPEYVISFKRHPILEQSLQF